MRILYVAGENPAVEAILNGMDTEGLSGLPAFYHPFRILLERGHEIDLLLYTREKKTLRESRYFHKRNLIQVCARGRLPLSLEYLLQMSSAAKKLLSRRHYDFVYGMSEGAHPVLIQAVKRGIPCGLRQFGTQEMADVLEGKKTMAARYLTAFRDYTYITLSMFSRKNFILATNDGSRADRIYDLLGVREKKFDFFFWRSGVEIPAVRPLPDLGDPAAYPAAFDPMALSMVNRVAEVKRQDRAVRILGELHRRGFPFHLYLVGTIDSRKMYQAAMEAADEYGIRDYVHFEGEKSQKECRMYARNSLATLLPCQWNRVNVFYEVMGEGALVLTNDNHSIDEFIEDGVNCLVYEEDNFGQAAEKLIAASQDHLLTERIRCDAHRTAAARFMSIEKRFGLEADLVEASAGGRDLSGFPPVL